MWRLFKLFCKESVRFYVSLQENADTKEIKKDLEQMAKDLSIRVLELFAASKYQVVIGETSQKTYERLFNAKLEYRVTKQERQNLVLPNKRKTYYTVKEWVELEPAKVPESLKDKIKSIELEPKGYLI